MVKKLVFVFLSSLATVLGAQPLVSGVGNSDKTAQIARIDSATLKLRNKLYTFEDKGELNVYGFDEGDIPIYSDSVVALRLSLLETEIPLEYN